MRFARRDYTEVVGRRGAQAVDSHEHGHGGDAVRRESADPGDETAFDACAVGEGDAVCEVARAHRGASGIYRSIKRG